MCERTKDVIKGCFNVERDPDKKYETPQFVRVTPVVLKPYSTDIRKILAENSMKR